MPTDQQNTQFPSRKRLFAIIVFIVLIVILGLLALRSFDDLIPKPLDDQYQETFDEVGSWTAGEGANAEGKLENGTYIMSMELTGEVFWATAGKNFADGVYQVEATPLSGVTNNGYGMLFRVDEEKNTFYFFKVSSDGYAYIGLCENNCLEQSALVDRDWFASPAINTGMEVTNTLRAELSGEDMVFFVNGEEIGRANDDSLANGDIGMIIETFAPGGLRVAFDNFTVQP